MKAMVLTATKQPLVMEDQPEPEPGEGQVAIRLRAAAINHRDEWIRQGMYPGIQVPAVLGSDGAGVVTGIGPQVADAWLGAEVVINPGLNWGSDEQAQGDHFHILGMPTPGTFAESVIVGADQIHRKPSHLTWEQAAALPLAGLTAYRALFHQGQMVSGETVLVTGVGGGVATFAVMFAVAEGAEVVVTSSSEHKIEWAQGVGAKAGFDYQDEDWQRVVADQFGSVDLAIDGAAGSNYANLIKLAGFGGRIVNYGATAGAPDRLDMFQVFWKQLTLRGSTMGSPHDFAKMLELVTQHRMVPLVDSTRPLAELNQALARIRCGEQLGKLVIRFD